MHWLVLQWAPCFEGLDVCLKGLAQRISRMFPISLQPNWAEGQQNSTCLCLAHFTFPNIYLSLYPVFRRLQGYASMGREKATRSNIRKADAKLPLSKLMHMNNDWGWGLEQRPAGIFLSLQRQQTQMAMARAGDQIRWTAPNGWAMSLPVVTGNSNWEKGGWEKWQEQSSRRSVSAPANDEKLQASLNNISFEKSPFESSASFQLADRQIPPEVMGTLIHINSVRHLE